MMQNRRNLVIFTLALVGILLAASIMRRWLLPQTITPPRDVVVVQAYELDSTVGDALVVIADTIKLNAHSRVGGDAALIGRTSVRIEGQIDGSLTVMSDMLEIGQNSRINGDVSFMGNRILVEGTISGDVTAVGQTLALGTDSQIAGTVTSCVSTLNQPTNLRPEQLRPCSGNEALRLFAPLQPLRASLNGVGIPAATLLPTLPVALALVALAALLVTALPRRFSRIHAVFYTAPGRPVGVGFLMLLVVIGLGAGLVALLALLPAVGLILLPFGLLLALALLVMALLGWTTLALLLGSRLLKRQDNPALPPLVSVLLGSLILCLLAYLLALVPFGLLLLLVALAGLSAVGLGAAFITRINRVRARREYAT